MLTIGLASIGPSRGLLRDCENFADGSFAALSYFTLSVQTGGCGSSSRYRVPAHLTLPSAQLVTRGHTAAYSRPCVSRSAGHYTLDIYTFLSSMTSYFWFQLNSYNYSSHGAASLLLQVKVRGWWLVPELYFIVQVSEAMVDPQIVFLQV